MTPGLIIGVVLLGLMAAWGLVILFRRTRERPSETSSHHESGSGIQGGGNPPE